MTNQDLGKIKLKAYIALVLSVCAVIPFVGKIFSIASYIVMFFAIKGVSGHSQSPTLLKHFTLFLVFMVASVVIGSISTLFTGVAVFSVIGGMGGVGIGYYAVKILGFAVALGGILYGFRYYKEMSKLTDINLFFIAYIFVLIDTVLTALWLGAISWVFLVISFIVELLAWIKLEHINKAEIQNKNE